jgi:hypothetical protein
MTPTVMRAIATIQEMTILETIHLHAALMFTGTTLLGKIEDYLSAQ